RIHLVISGSGLKVMREELDLDVTRSSEIPSALAGQPVTKTVYLLDSDIGASIASGSYPVDGMVVIPCTTGCLAQIAQGISETLIERAADVCLKEGHKVVLAVRDAPFNRIHLENMLRAQAAGAVIFPIIPSFTGQSPSTTSSPNSAAEYLRSWGSSRRTNFDGWERSLGLGLGARGWLTLPFALCLLPFDLLWLQRTSQSSNGKMQMAKLLQP